MSRKVVSRKEINLKKHKSEETNKAESQRSVFQKIEECLPQIELLIS